MKIILPDSILGKLDHLKAIKPYHVANTNTGVVVDILERFPELNKELAETRAKLDEYRQLESAVSTIFRIMNKPDEEKEFGPGYLPRLNGQ